MIDIVFYATIIIAAVLVELSKYGLMVSIGAVNVPFLALVMPARDAAGRCSQSCWSSMR